MPSPPAATSALSDSTIAPWADDEGVAAKGEAGERAKPEPESEMSPESQSTLKATGAGAIHDVPKSQNYVALDEGSFDYELATAARATGPTVHDVNGSGTGGVANPTEVEFNGQATQGQVM